MIKQLGVYAFFTVLLLGHSAWSDSSSPLHPLQQRRLNEKEISEILKPCVSLLEPDANAITPVKVSNAYGLFMDADSARQHSQDFSELYAEAQSAGEHVGLTVNDLLAARQYASQLSPKLRFSLIGSFEDTAIPGFDGMEEDRQGNPIRRIQLKHIFDMRKILKQTRRAVEKAILYASPASWLRLMYLNVHGEYCFGAAIVQSDSHCFESFDGLKEWTRKVFSYFRISLLPGKSLSTAVVMDLDPSIRRYPDKQIQDEIQNLIRASNGAISEVIFLKGQGSTLHLSARGSEWVRYNPH